MIELIAVSKTYAGSNIKAVDGLSLKISDGEIFGFLGPNGAGKTTSLKILTGVLKADSGQAMVDGTDVSLDPIAAKSRIGYVSDNPEAFAKLKAVEYLNFIADVYGLDSEQRHKRINDYSSRFEIRDALSSSLASFSRGMKQKLFIVASLLPDPQNWVLDEPMVGLDPKAAFALKSIMRNRADSGKTVFFSTHVMEVAERLCDKLAIINKGKIIFIGSFQELKKLEGEDTSLETLFLELTEKSGELAGNGDAVL